MSDYIPPPGNAVPFVCITDPPYNPPAGNGLKFDMLSDGSGTQGAFKFPFASFMLLQPG